MEKATIVGVPGAWHTPEAYGSVFKLLESSGYPTIGLPLPSVGAPIPLTDRSEDVKSIRQCLTTLVEVEEKEVVLVLHSYSGMPGNEAPKGLGKRERESKGLKGGVIRLVFVMAVAMPEGFKPMTEGVPFPAWMKLDVEVSAGGAIEPVIQLRSPCLTTGTEGSVHRRSSRCEESILQRIIL
jgi:hypothetical protein